MPKKIYEIAAKKAKLVHEKAAGRKERGIERAKRTMLKRFPALPEETANKVIARAWHNGHVGTVASIPIVTRCELALEVKFSEMIKVHVWHPSLFEIPCIHVRRTFGTTKQISSPSRNR